MAGWGSWTGKGAPTPKMNRRHSKNFKKSKAKIAMAAKAKRDARKDRHLKHVIISEKRNKHVAKYNVETVPHPFKTRAEYEASLRNPLGPNGIQLTCTRHWYDRKWLLMLVLLSIQLK